MLTALGRRAARPLRGARSMSEAPYVVRVNARAPKRLAVIQPKLGPTERLTSAVALDEACELARSCKWGVAEAFTAAPASLLDVLPAQSGAFDAVLVNSHRLTTAQRVALTQGAKGLPVLDRFDLLSAYCHANTHSSVGKLLLAYAEALRRKHDSDNSFVHKGDSLVAIEGDPRPARRAATDHALLLRSKILHANEQKAKLLKQKLPTVAFVGYMNAGKTDLIEALRGADRKGADCPLEPIAYPTRLPGGLSAVLLDTVGVVADMPSEFVDAFKPSLQAVEKADLIVLVRPEDGPASPHHPAIVYQMLSDNMHLDIAGIPKLEVVIASGKAASSGTVIGRLADPSLVHVNLQSTDDCNRLKALLENKLAHVTGAQKVDVLVPMEDAEQLSWLYRNAGVTSAEPTADSKHVLVVCVMDDAKRRQFEGHFKTHVSRVPDRVLTMPHAPKSKRDLNRLQRHNKKDFFNQRDDD